MVLVQQIKQIKIQIFPQDVSHALTSQWPPSGSCDRFRDLFLYCPPTHPSPRFDRFTDLFLFESDGQTYLNAAPHAAGFCPVYFLRTVIICNNRVFASRAVNGGSSVVGRSSFWSGIMLSVGGCYIALGIGGGENYSYIWAQSMVRPCPR